MAALTPTGKERRTEGYSKAVGGRWILVPARYVRSNGQSILVEGYHELVDCRHVWVEKDIECRGVAMEDGVPRAYLGWYEVRHVDGEIILSVVPGTLEWGEIIPSSDGGNDANPS